MSREGLPHPWPVLVSASARHDLSNAIHPSRAQAHGEPSIRSGMEAALLERAPPRLSARLRAPGADWRGQWLRADSPLWPERLRGVPFGPVALCWEGNLSRLSAPAVAIVGARACSGRGRAWARELAREVTQAGAVVVSGLAWGIDAEAHATAGGSTIAVLGQGLAASMPPWQVRLRDQLLASGGLLLSERPPDAPAQPWAFPVRNRVLAALSQVVVVVEAGARSGARITARMGLTMGREVMAVPGPPGEESWAGCHALLEEGAAPVRSAEDVLRALAEAQLATRAPEARLSTATPC
jgi:DNA processing protein